ncbi:MAG: hypothetical protein ACLP66_22415 [Polyangia bacterium]
MGQGLSKQGTRRMQELENYAFPFADQATTDLLLGINREARSSNQDRNVMRPADISPDFHGW